MASLNSIVKRASYSGVILQCSFGLLKKTGLYAMPVIFSVDLLNARLSREISVVLVIYDDGCLVKDVLSELGTENPAVEIVGMSENSLGLYAFSRFSTSLASSFYLKCF